MTEMKTVFIFIDGSYFCFHRYYSIARWWKNAHPEAPKIPENPIENSTFHDKFAHTFLQTVREIPKKLGISKDTPYTMLVGKDEKREKIWRNAYLENYKANRKNSVEHGFMGGPLFQMAYEKGLFVEGGAKTVLSGDELEADDCIAISTHYLLEKYKDDPNLEIYIITSDKDYLQLIEPRVKIMDLSFRNLAEQKSSFGDAKANLFCKIIMGDVSDNIPAIFKKCGPKTAWKCFQDPAYFEEKMKKENSYEKWEKNRKLVDFWCIPEILRQQFLEKYNKDMLNW